MGPGNETVADFSGGLLKVCCGRCCFDLDSAVGGTGLESSCGIDRPANSLDDGFGANAAGHVLDFEVKDDESNNYY